MTQAIFLSYTSQDADAARRICDALRAAGLEAWFDQSDLRGGEAWDASIRKQPVGWVNSAIVCPTSIDKLTMLGLMWPAQTYNSGAAS